jgi:hypothetical protein
VVRIVRKKIVGSLLFAGWLFLFLTNFNLLLATTGQAQSFVHENDVQGTTLSIGNLHGPCSIPFIEITEEKTENEEEDDDEKEGKKKIELQTYIHHFQSENLASVSKFEIREGQSRSNPIYIFCQYWKGYI